MCNNLPYLGGYDNQHGWHTDSRNAPLLRRLIFHHFGVARHILPLHTIFCTLLLITGNFYTDNWFCLFFFSAGMHFCPCWPGWCADWQCLLGTVLSGAWNSARWADAQWQNYWRWRWLLQYLLQWDWGWETCASSCFCGSGTYRDWWVVRRGTWFSHSEINLSNFVWVLFRIQRQPKPLDFVAYI